MAGIEHRPPLREKERWDGGERRGAKRQRFEQSSQKGHIPSELRRGMNSRVQDAIRSQESATFSSSARRFVTGKDSTILQSGAQWTVHQSTADPYGKTVHGEDCDGEWDIDNSQVGSEGRYVLQKLPIKVIPHMPVDPKETQKKAREGTLGFEHLWTRMMGLIVWSEKDGWSDAYYCPAGDIATPATSRRYGEEMFGGIATFDLPNGEVVMLRPDFHTGRFFSHAARMCMADFRDDDRRNERHTRDFSEKDMTEMLKHVVRANIAYMPPHETGGRLYLSPVAYAAGPHLSASRNEKIVIATEAFPIGKYFQDPLRLKIEKEFHRVGPGMLGDVKAGGGYVTGFEADLLAIAEGFDKCVFLDPSNERILELNAANIFFVIGDRLVTPNLSGEILEGVTRDTVLRMAVSDPKVKKMFAGVHDEEPVLIRTIAEIFQSRDRSKIKAFVTGTAATIHRVSSLNYNGVPLVCDEPAPGETDIIEILSERFKKLVDGKLESDADSEVRELYKGMLVRVCD